MKGGTEQDYKKEVLCTRAHREEFDFFQESPADRDESLLWPLMEPVNTGTVSDGRKLTTTDTQSAANW